MECRNIREFLGQYRDGTLSALKAEGVRKHLEGCKRCALEYRTLCEALDYLRSVPDEELPAGFYEGLDRKLEQELMPWYKKAALLLNLWNIGVAVGGILVGVIAGISFSNTLAIVSPANQVKQEIKENKVKYAAMEKDKDTSRIVMRTGNIYQAGYDIDRIVSRYEGAGSTSDPVLSANQGMKILRKKYIITVFASQYENLVKELNGMGYMIKLPDKKEMAELKKLKSTDQVKLELDITE